MEHYIKSYEKSTRLREIGNQFYSKRRFFDAIVKYNESLCFAERKSENLGLAYANRSAAYFEMKLYNHSLRNIELAKGSNYPSSNYEILKRREDKCNEMMKTYSNTKNEYEFFKLSDQQHKTYSSIVNSLELKCNQEYGRYVISNKTLSVGDVIAIEEPVCKILKVDYVFQRCSYCLKSNLLDLIPCSECTCAMFCSDACLKEGYRKFHKYECGISKFIISSTLNTNMQIAMRIFLEALDCFNESIPDLTLFLKESSPCSAFDISSNATLKEKILALNSSVFDETVKVDDAQFKKVFLHNEKLQQVWNAYENDIILFLVKHTQIATLNCHEIYGWPLKKGGLLDPELENYKETLAYCRNVTAFANGRYLFASLLNHSCAPNVSKIFVDDKIVIIVQRPIKAGEQIFDNYGCSFTNIPKETRQSELLEQFKFFCKCVACVGNFSLLPALKINDKIIFRNAKKTCQELKNLNRKKSKQKIQVLSEILQKYQRFPCLETCSLIESFQACLELSVKPEILFP